MITAHDIIIKPIITEKSMALTEANKYTFKVMKKANKTEVKKAVETVFGVKVEKVNIMNVTGKKRRVGANVGKKPDWKKAVVILKPGSKAIEFFEGM